MPSPEKAHHPETGARPHPCHRWCHPPASLTLGAEAVHVWRIPLAAPPSAVASLRRLLSDEEEARAARMLAPGADRRFVISHGATRAILARYLDRPPEQIHFVTGDLGKPHLELSGAPTLHFNLSHSADLALCAVARDRAVGVDVERSRPLAAWPQIAARYFSPAENETLHSLAGEAALEAFFRVWTGKEAYAKALGQGISRSWTRFSIPLEPMGTAVLPGPRPDASTPIPITVLPLEAGPGYAAAVAGQGEDWRLSCWGWSWAAGAG